MQRVLEEPGLELKAWVVVGGGGRVPGPASGEPITQPQVTPDSICSFAEEEGPRLKGWDHLQSVAFLCPRLSILGTAVHRAGFSLAGGQRHRRGCLRNTMGTKACSVLEGDQDTLLSGNNQVSQMPRSRRQSTQRREPNGVVVGRAVGCGYSLPLYFLLSRVSCLVIL